MKGTQPPACHIAARLPLPSPPQPPSPSVAMGSSLVSVQGTAGGMGEVCGASRCLARGLGPMACADPTPGRTVANRPLLPDLPPEPAGPEPDIRGLD